MATLAKEDFRLIYAEHVLRLDGDAFARWERYGLEPEAVPVAGSKSAPGAFYLIAKAEDQVMVFDVADRIFGIGVMDSGGVVHNWESYGGELRWALLQFPSATNITPPSA